MAKQNFSFYIKRDQHRKRPGRHSKSLNKSAKLGHNKKYNRQGRGWQTSQDILYIGHERNNN